MNIPNILGAIAIAIICTIMAICSFTNIMKIDNIGEGMGWSISTLGWILVAILYNKYSEKFNNT